MKKLLFALCVLIGLSLSSCYDDSALWSRISILESAMFQKQIDALDVSVESLKKVDLEIKNMIIALQGTDGDVSNQIEELKGMDSALDAKIETLKSILETDKINTKNWAETTFATLSQYNELVDDLSELNDLIAAELSGVKSLIKENYDSLVESVATTSSEIRTWVDATLKNYATNKDLQSAAEGLQEGLDGLVARLDALELRVSTLETQVTAINATIASLQEMDNQINAAIEQLKSVDGAAQSQIDGLVSYSNTLKSSIDELKSLHDQSISSTKDWVDATFATLEQYNGLVGDLSGLNELLVLNISNVEKSIEDNYKDISAKISDVKATIEEWVAGTLENYATNEALQDAASELKGRLDELSAKLEALENRVNELENTLAGLTREFTINFSVPKVVIDEGESMTISYTLTGATSKTAVKTVCQSGWSAIVSPSGSDSGTMTVTAPASFTESEILVFVYDGEHRTIMNSLLCLKPVDLSSDATANCYIVPEYGGYKFKTVKGNSVEPVGDVASVSVLWESFGTDVVPDRGDLIADISYENNYVSFRTSPEYKEGNALIVASDIDDNILWSWHIWLAEKPEDQVYRNNAGIMMDRNLGATSATPGDVGALGLLYQWGRKDPFLGSSSTSSRIKAASTITWPSVVASDQANGTIEYTIAHPTTFITPNAENMDWYYYAGSTGSDETDNTRWQSVKTVYDPCPAGYRVPDGGPDGIWSVAFGISNRFDEDALDLTNKGFNFGNSVNTRRLTDKDADCWYPAIYYLNDEDASFGGGYGYGYYWSCSYIASYNYSVYSFGFDLGSSVYPWRDDPRALGFSVRCMKE